MRSSQQTNKQANDSEQTNKRSRAQPAADVPQSAQWDGTVTRTGDSGAALAKALWCRRRCCAMRRGPTASRSTTSSRTAARSRGRAARPHRIGIGNGSAWLHETRPCRCPHVQALQAHTPSRARAHAYTYFRHTRNGNFARSLPLTALGERERSGNPLMSVPYKAKDGRARSPERVCAHACTHTHTRAHACAFAFAFCRALCGTSFCLASKGNGTGPPQPTRSNSTHTTSALRASVSAVHSV